MSNAPAVKLAIERLVFGGEGLARLGDGTAGQAQSAAPEAILAGADAAPASPETAPAGRGKAVFVPLVLPGEIVEAQLEEDHRSYAHARLLRVLRPAAARQSPPCPYFGECGGCQWQQIVPAAQLEYKQAILAETLGRLAGLRELPPIELHRSPPWQYRNRARWRMLASTPRLGYRRWHSRVALGVSQCRLLHPALERLTQLDWPAPPREIEELEAAVNEAGELQLHWLARDASEDLAAWCKAAAELAGARAAAVTSGAETRALGGGDAALTLTVNRIAYRLSPGAFFQVNRFLLPELATAMAADTGGERALDLYSGVGLFALPLLDGFGWVSAVEAEATAASDLRWNARHAQGAGDGRLHVSAMTAEEFIERSSGQSFDLAIVDPPRAGLGKRVLAGLLRLQPRRLHYLSCDPATLARDLKPLCAAGYQIEQLHLFDLFPQTYHLETLVRLRRD